MHIKSTSQNKIKETRSDAVFYALNGFFVTLFFIITLYPLLCLISSAISSPAAVYTGRVTFYPIGFSLLGFKTNLKNANIHTGFYNTLIYTVSGTLLTVVITLITGFALSRRELLGRGIISFIFAFTMWFSGGLIPFYLLIRDLGMYNTRWALIIPGMVSVWFVIVCRTNINTTIPEEMFEAASIDGCGYFRFLLSIVMPLSKPIIAVLVLWSAIGHWNAYFNALIFLTDKSLKPLQLFLRDYLVASNVMDLSSIDFTTESLGIQELVKNSLILMSVLPLWILYPFIQKYFVRGVMVGSVKG